MQIRTRPIAIIAFSDGEQVVLGFVSRAPFPQLPSVSPSRIAVMQMLAMCRDDAMKLCPFSPGEHVCPGKVARCLVAQEDRISHGCHQSLIALEMAFNHHAREGGFKQSHDHHDATDTGKLKGSWQYVCHICNGILDSTRKHGFFGELGALFALILCMMVLKGCLCPTEEEENVQGAGVVMSEPPQIVILTAPAGCMLGQGEPVVKFDSSENQV